jgi:hypothetical protein
MDWHANLFVETHVAAIVAVASQYSQSPARFDVACHNVSSRRLGRASAIRLAVAWHKDTA